MVNKKTIIISMLIPVLFLLLWKTAFTQTKEIVISFVGDVYPQMLDNSDDKVIQKLNSYFENSHIVFCNLESPITSNDVPTSGKCPKAIEAKKDYLLRSRPDMITPFSKIGFDVVSMANNHTMDYKAAGLKETIKLLKKHEIAYCGAGNNIDEAEAPVIIERAGIKTAFIAYSEFKPINSAASPYSPGIAGINYPPCESDYDRIERSINAAKEMEAEIIIVSLHWGLESSSQVEEYQRTAARRILDLGADCIIGHHPHVLRDIETYNGKTIAYSLGNYIFYSANPDTIILRIKFTKNSKGRWKQKIEKEKMTIVDCIPEKDNP